MSSDPYIICNKKKCLKRIPLDPDLIDGVPHKATCPHCGGQMYFCYSPEDWPESKASPETIGSHIEIKTTVCDGKITQMETDRVVKKVVRGILDTKDTQIAMCLNTLGWHEVGVCKWHYQEQHAYYETDCGGSHKVMNLAGPFENKYKFCPYCGGKIEL